MSRLGGYLLAGALATAMSLPLLWRPWAPLVRVEKRQVDSQRYLPGHRCVDAHALNTPYVKCARDIPVTEKEWSLVRGAGQSQYDMHESPDGGYIAFLNLRRDGTIRSCVLDRDAMTVKDLDLEGAVELLRWVSSKDLQVKRNTEHGTRISYVHVPAKTVRYETDAVYKTRAVENTLWLGCLVALIAVGYQVRKRLEGRLPPGDEGSLFERAIKPLVLHGEEVAATAGVTALLSYRVWSTAAYSPLEADILARVLPVASIGAGLLAGIARTQAESVEQPVALHILPYIASLAGDVVGRKGGMPQGVIKHASARIRLVYRVKLACEAQDYPVAFDALEDLMRTHVPAPSICNAYVLGPLSAAVTKALAKVVNEKDTVANCLASAAAHAVVGEYGSALRCWDGAMAMKDARIPALELAAGKAKLLRSIEIKLREDGVHPSQYGQLTAYFKTVRERGAFADAAHDCQEAMWREVIPAMENGTRCYLSDRTNINKVFVVEGDYLLPRALVMKVGADVARLGREYTVLQVLHGIMPPGRVALPLYFDTDSRDAVLLQERMKGRTLESMVAGVEEWRPAARAAFEIVEDFSIRADRAIARFAAEGVELPSYDVRARVSEYASRRFPSAAREWRVLLESVASDLPADRFCHGDAHPAQVVISDKGGMTVLDPEWASTGYVCKDIARMSTRLPEDPCVEAVCAELAAAAYRRSHDESALLFERVRLQEYLLLARWHDVTAADPVGERRALERVEGSLRRLTEMGWSVPLCRRVLADA